MVMERLSREFGDGLFLLGRGEAGSEENNGKSAVVERVVAGLGRNRDKKIGPLDCSRCFHTVPKAGR
ncbi:hypothetical protein AMQ84_15135 [Paenibacillus riograndensis]|uniref:Uncharacterized protein n=1 Tax=Paenibacillus riograndensis TaxID=483937 RepID=A0A132TYD0_9BACL|nr:hypothetical protein AMQ84_15135 [Paenibacillus riograndensis]